MKKVLRILILSVAVVTLLLLAVLSVSAAGETTEGATDAYFKAVDANGENAVYYTNLPDAVAGVPEGGTVYFLKDFDNSATDAHVTIQVTKDLTIDGQGYTLKTHNSWGLQTGSNSGKTVTIKNLTINGGTGYYGINLSGQHTVKLINTTVTAGQATLHINRAGTLWLADDPDSTTDKNVITSTTAATSGAIQSAGSNGAKGGALIIDNAEVTAARYVMYLPSEISVTVNGGTFISDKYPSKSASEAVGRYDFIYAKTAGTLSGDTYEILIDGAASITAQSPVRVDAGNWKVTYKNMTFDNAANGTVYAYVGRISGAVAATYRFENSHVVDAATTKFYANKPNAHFIVDLDENSTVNAASTNYALTFNSSNITANNVTVTLKGSGKIGNNLDRQYSLLLDRESFTLNIEGSLHLSGTRAPLYVGKNVGVTLNISGGLFLKSTYYPSIYIVSSAVATTSAPGKITISGGEFYAGRLINIDAYDTVWDISITGVTVTALAEDSEEKMETLLDLSAGTVNLTLGEGNSIHTSGQFIKTRGNADALTLNVTGGTYSSDYFLDATSGCACYARVNVTGGSIESRYVFYFNQGDAATTASALTVDGKNATLSGGTLVTANTLFTDEEDAGATGIILKNLSYTSTKQIIYARTAVNVTIDNCRLVTDTDDAIELLATGTTLSIDNTLLVLIAASYGIEGVPTVTLGNLVVLSQTHATVYGDIKINGDAGAGYYGGDTYYIYMHMPATSATYNPTNTDPEMSGAAVYIGDDIIYSGLRFITVLSEEMIAAAAAAEQAGKTVAYGTVIAPMDYVAKAGKFTIDALASLDIAETKTTYVKIEASGSIIRDDAGNVTAYSGSLIRLKEGNYGRVFAGIAYVEIDGEIYYGAFDSATTARSAKRTAKAALLDTSKTYSDEEIAVLQAYAGKFGISDYSIVYSATATDYVKEKASALIAAVENACATAADVTVADETTSLHNQLSYEILIGDLDALATKTALAKLGTNGYGVVIVDNKIVVLGTSELLTTMAIDLFMEKYFDALVNGELSVLTDTIYTNVSMTEITADYSVVFPASLDSTIGTNPSYAAENREYTYDYPVMAAKKLYDSLVAAGIAIPEANWRGDSTTTAKEILVGLVSRSEMSTLLATMGENDYGFLMKNGKLLVAAINDTQLANAYALTEMILASAKTSAGKILIPTDYAVQRTSTTAFVTDFPRPTGTGIALTETQDVYNDSMLYLYSGSGINEAAFDTYHEKLLAANYTVYMENAAEDSRFITYVNADSTQVLHVIYATYKHAEAQSVTITSPCIRIVSAPANKVTLPDQSLIAQNLSGYTKVTDSKLTSVELNWMENLGDENVDIRGYGNCYIITLEDGSFLIIDSGFSVPVDNEKFHNLLCALHKEATGKAVSISNPLRIAAWVLTHDHGDHTNLFYWFAKTYGSQAKYQIDYVFANFVSDEQLYNAQDVSVTRRNQWANGTFAKLEPTGKRMQYIKVHTGQKFYIANAEIEILYTHEDMLPSRLHGFNGSSTIYRINLAHTDGAGNKTGATFSSIFMGDSERIGNDKMRALFGDYLKADALQLAHHGLNGDYYVAKCVQPTAILLPQWLDYATLYCHPGEYNDLDKKPYSYYYGWGGTYAATHLLDCVRYIIVEDHYHATVVLDADGVDFELKSDSNPDGMYDLMEERTMVWSTIVNSDIYGNGAWDSAIIKRY